jgi:hypothetical protein
VEEGKGFSSSACSLLLELAWVVMYYYTSYYTQALAACDTLKAVNPQKGQMLASFPSYFIMLLRHYFAYAWLITCSMRWLLVTCSLYAAGPRILAVSLPQL